MTQQFEGDFKLKSITLTPVAKGSEYAGSAIDIKELIAEINIKESVLSTSLYCSVVVQDIGENLIEKLPIMGQEKIRMVVSTAKTSYTLEFVVYSVDGRTMMEKNQVYILHCCSREALVNETYRITERLDGVKAHEFVSDKLEVITEKKLNFDETLHKFDMYVPNWRFFDTCAWFRPRTVATEHKDSVGYLFWEGFEKYNFKSVDTLFNQTPYPSNSVKYSYVQANAAIDDTQRRIKKYASPKAFNVFNDARAGGFAHNACYVDINTRSYRIFRTTADDFWDDSVHLGDLKPYRTDAPVNFALGSGRMVYRPTTVNTFGKWEDLEEKGELTEDEWVDQKNKMYEKALYRFYFMEYNKLDIAIPGDLDLRAGSIINVSIPSPNVNNGNVKEDKRMSGRYLVNSVHHTLNRDKLNTKVTLTRDSYGGTSLPDSEATRRQVNLGNK